jgi:hypothetical protein
MIRPWIQSGAFSPGQQSVHVLNRLAFGPRPGDIDYVSQIGLENWIERQLHPDSIAEPTALQQHITSLPTLHMTPEELFIRYQMPLLRQSCGPPLSVWPSASAFSPVERRRIQDWKWILF